MPAVPLYAAPDVYRGTQAPSDMRSAMPRPKTPSEEASEEFFKKTWSSFMKQLAAQRREYFYDDFERCAEGAAGHWYHLCCDFVFEPAAIPSGVALVKGLAWLCRV